MHTSFVRRSVGAALAFTSCAALTAPVHAQAPVIARVTPYVGYLNFGDFVDGPIGTRVTNENAAVYGLQAGLDLSPRVTLVGNVGYSDSNLRLRLPLGFGVNVAGSKVLLFDAGLQFRFPTTTALAAGVTPFVEAGAGAIRYEVNALQLTANTTNFAGNFGGGVDVNFNRNVGLRLQAKDYVARFDFDAAESLGLRGKIAHNISLNVGLNIGF